MLLLAAALVAANLTASTPAGPISRSCSAITLTAAFASSSKPCPKASNAPNPPPEPPPTTAPPAAFAALSAAAPAIPNGLD